MDQDATATNPEASQPRPTSDQLLLVVYDELRRLAHHRLAQEPPGQTVTATALVHEVYLRLGRGAQWDGPDHFFSAAAQAMRRILVERAREKAQVKRGGKRVRVELGDVAVIGNATDEDLLALDQALAQLEQQDARKGEVVRLRYFAGLTVERVAEVMGISPRLVNKEWTFARAWLKRQIVDNSDQL